jgi:hypothetical protein
VNTSEFASFPSITPAPLARARRTLWLSCQRVFWTTAPLTVAVGQRLLRRVDAQAELRRRCHSETHQVFRGTFRGAPAIVKFSGQDFWCKFILRGEAFRLRRLYASGAPVPELLHGAEHRGRHPFFVTRDLGAVPRAQWNDDVHRRCIDFQAQLIDGFTSTMSAAAIPMMTRDDSRESMLCSIATTEDGLREFAILRPEFIDALAIIRREINRYPWVMGALQPPEPIFDGTRFWAVDWDRPKYVPPLKWVCDYTYFMHVRDPALGWRYASGLADALELRLSDVGLRASLRPWYRFKALEVGVFLLRKYHRWDYFRSLQRTFFGDVLTDPSPAWSPVLGSSFAV